MDTQSIRGEQMADEKPKASKQEVKVESKYSCEEHLSMAKAMHGCTRYVVSGALAVLKEKTKDQEFTKSQVKKAIDSFLNRKIEEK